MQLALQTHFHAAIWFVGPFGGKAPGGVTHVHHGVDLCDRFVVRGELVDLHPVADQLAHDLDLELVQLALGDGVCLGNDGDDVHLQHRREGAITRGAAPGSAVPVG